MTKIDFVDYICRPFCTFFREGEKEEMACRGARMIELLVGEGKLDPAGIPPLRKSPSVWRRHDVFLGLRVCGACEFRAEDCDYRSESPPEDAEPCGGAILIALLLDSGMIEPAALEVTE